MNDYDRAAYQHWYYIKNKPKIRKYKQKYYELNKEGYHVRYLERKARLKAQEVQNE